MTTAKPRICCYYGALLKQGEYARVHGRIRQSRDSHEKRGEAMTLEQVERTLSDISDDAYAVDPSIRHDPFYQSIQRVRQTIRDAVDQAQDDAMDEEYLKWCKTNK